MDDSVVDISTSLYIIESTDDLEPLHTSIIDLTKDSPRPISRSRSRQRNTQDVSSSHSTTGNSDHRRPISPIVLGSITYTETRNSRKRIKGPSSTSSTKVVILNNTSKDDTNYTIQSDNKESILLSCPICLEALSSKLKPITTRCGHLFCSECLQTYLRTVKKCPTCKSVVTLKSCTRLYL